MRAEHAQKVENMPGFEACANSLAQKENLFAALRQLAIHSWNRPSENGNLALFAKPASEVMAKLMIATAAAYTFPYEELVQNERAAKTQAQQAFAQERNERNQIQNNYNQAQARLDLTQAALREEQAAKNRIHANFVMQRDVKNQLQIDLNNTQERLNQTRTALHAEQAARQQLEQDARQTDRVNEHLLESYRDRIVRLTDLNEVTTAELDQKKQLYTAEVESTRLNSELALLLQQNLDQERERRTTETEDLRKQISPLRKRADQVSPLRRLNENLMRRLIVAESQLKEQAASPHVKHTVKKNNK